MALNWYVVHCDAHQDRQVQRLVEQRSVDVFAPRVPRTRKRNGDKPLFPGYLFVRLELESGMWDRLRYLPGVRSLVEIGGGPCPVDERVVDEVRRRAAVSRRRVSDLRVGDQVTVTSGVLADLDGVFSERVSGEDRVAILLDLMHRQVSVVLPAGEIKPAV